MTNNQTIHIILHNQDDQIICPYPQFNCLSSPTPTPHKLIKKQLKKVVTLSNNLQDAVNILKSMLNNNLTLEELMVQRRHIATLNSQQQDEIRKLQHLEFKYPEEKRNRFFYFREVPIPWP